ncbi:ferric reductase like transmembrane component-domain-containing protein [Mycotypha africana]|uniref:ferric reductase like transmembrane component-domain-containing protein n=1 Tax=Mycotypha africana TaxID=64632 RepID=UPI0022FFED6F|nr:ferric reductase like transmembrane component-domain-containing protein [Mycotypha africana]KAI8975477.1 ferric reductase like transmembrane component-domain-containing protein [Mycotypha africana]
MPQFSQQNPNGTYRPYLRTDSNFWMCGMAYAFFWWICFIVYCLYYQLNRIRIYYIRKRRLKGENVVVADLPGAKFLHSFDFVVRIPFVTEMIPVKDILGVLIFCVIDIFFLLFVAPYDTNPNQKVIAFVSMPVSILDRRSAFLGLVNWSFVFFLAQRNSCLPKLSGLTFEELIPFHRIFARVGYANFLPHFIYRIYDGFIREQSYWGMFFKDETYTAGSIAMFSYIIIFITSLEFIRRNHFELFYWSHIIFLISAIMSTILHYPTCAAFYTPPTLLWIADRAIRSYKSWYTQCSSIQIEQVAKQTELQDGIIRVLFENNNMLQHFKPGNYVFAAFVLNDHKLWEYANWHPFTISEIFRVTDSTTIANYAADEEVKTIAGRASSNSSFEEGMAVINDTTPLLANGSTVSFSSMDDDSESIASNIYDSANINSSGSSLNPADVAYLRHRSGSRAHMNNIQKSYRQNRAVATFHIKALGTKTKDLLRAAAVGKDGTQLSGNMKVYIDGLYGPKLQYQDYPTLALFATGIGITPAMAIVKDVIDKRSMGVRTYTTDTLYITWAVRVIDEIKPFLDMFSYWSEKAKQSILPIQLSMTIYVSGMMAGSSSLESMDGFKLIYGQRPRPGINLEKIKNASMDDRVWVHVCGSTSFTKAVVNEAVRHRFHFHKETFEF